MKLQFLLLFMFITTSNSLLAVEVDASSVKSTRTADSTDHATCNEKGMAVTEKINCVKREIVRLQKELNKKQNEKNYYLPREKFVTASVTDKKYGGYFKRWRSLVQSIGNLNYPEKARENRIHGSVIVFTRIGSDGSLLGLKVRKSSGHMLLDEAAMDAVKKAAPFESFSDEIRSETDIIVISSTFNFLPGKRISAKRD